MFMHHFRITIFLLLGVVLLCLVWTVPARAEERVYIDITQPFFQRLPVAIPDFKYLTSNQTQLSREMATTLAKDLDFSGLFRPLDPAGFLEDSQKTGLTVTDLNFPVWRRTGPTSWQEAVMR